MEQERIDKARKELASKKTKSNFILIKMGYEMKLILNYVDGVKVMEAMSHCEKLEKEYGKTTRVSPFDASSFEVTILSYAEYERYKVATLLEVDPTDLDLNSFH